MPLSDYRFTIIHGSFGSPNSNWFPWLKAKLEAAGAEVFSPQFPINEAQSLSSWKQTFGQEVGELTSRDVLIGHSIGVAFTLRLLEDTSEPIAGAFLVSGFTDLLNNEHFDPVNHTFTDDEFKWGKIRSAAKAFYLYHGTDDPYVPQTFSQAISQEVSGKLTIIPGGKHLSASGGFTEFPQLWSDLESALA